MARDKHDPFALFTFYSPRWGSLMLYALLYPLHTSYSAFNVFRYITFRTLLAAIMALSFDDA